MCFLLTPFYLFLVILSLFIAQLPYGQFVAWQNACDKGVHTKALLVKILNSCLYPCVCLWL